MSNLGTTWLRPGEHAQWQSVVFLDLDATIIRGPFESAVFPIVFAELAQKSGLDVQEVRRRTIQEYLDRQRDPNIPATRAVDWDDILNTVAEGLRVKLEAKAVDIVNSHAGPPYAAVLDGADQVLRQLASPRRAIVVATRGLRKYQLPVLDALGLMPLFTDILTPDVNNALKNNIAFYGRWPEMTRLQISVGDHYEDDVVSPRRFGFKTIWKLNDSNTGLGQLDPFARPAEFSYARDASVRPDAIIFSLHELPAVVNRMEEQASVGPGFVTPPGAPPPRSGGHGVSSSFVRVNSAKGLDLAA
jgi:putative hydrolase of the HAD superfamily